MKILSLFDGMSCGQLALSQLFDNFEYFASEIDKWAIKVTQANFPKDREALLKDVIENGWIDRDKAYCLDANYHKGSTLDGYLRKHRRQIVFTDAGYRKLTPTECERLQTVPDGYTAHVSNTQRYKMLGNGWTVEVIKHILSSIPLNEYRAGQRSLFDD